MAASSLQTNKILVKGIPRSLHPDKLTIYFQKRKFGGGDVSSVTFPATSKDSDSAIVAFEDPQTVISVLKHQHKIAGALVTVQALSPQPEIFSEVTVQLSEFTINCITSKSKLDDALEKVCDSTGCEYESEAKILLTGKWYQIQAAFERFEDIISAEYEKPSTQAKDEKPSSQTTPMTSYSAGAQSKPSTYREETRVPDSLEIVSTVLDKDIFAYMELVHKKDLDHIRNSNRVQVLERTVDDAVYLTFKAKDGCYNATVEKALGDFRSFYNTVNASIHQDVIELNFFRPMPTPAIVAQTVRKVGAQYHTVQVSRMSTNDDTVIFTASSEMDCKSAMASFKVIMNSLL